MGAAMARLDPVNKPELLPAEFTTVIDVAGFLTPGEEERVASKIAKLEKVRGGPWGLGWEGVRLAAWSPAAETLGLNHCSQPPSCAEVSQLTLPSPAPYYGLTMFPFHARAEGAEGTTQRARRCRGGGEKPGLTLEGRSSRVGDCHMSSHHASTLRRGGGAWTLSRWCVDVPTGHGLQAARAGAELPRDTRPCHPVRFRPLPPVSHRSHLPAV